MPDPSALDLAFDTAVSELPIVAILRASTNRHLVAAATVLAEEGVRVIEFPLTTPGALDAIAEAVSSLGSSVVIGAGTVLDEKQARAAADAGARLLVSPGLCPGALTYGRSQGIPVLPGVFTASEVLQALDLGARLVKLFPADAVNPGYLRALHGPLPGLRVVPTGGIQIAGVRPWLSAGATALGIGTPLHGDTLETGDLGALRESARAWAAEARP